MTLDLTINNSVSGTDTQVACGSFTWIDGNTYTQVTIATFNIFGSSNGCDSIVTLDLPSTIQFQERYTGGLWIIYMD